MALDLVGQRFGRLVVKDRTRYDYGSGGRSEWVCSCDCGGTIQVPTGRLKLGKTKSCGCLARENRLLHSGKSVTTHGMTNSTEYRIWAAMKSRCSNSNTPDYSRYGGRGITVCDRWKDSFENFYADMGARPSMEMTLDREKNDGNYEPDNCRWATRIEQSNNRAVNVRYPFQGEELTLPEIARRIGINAHTLATRLNRGWSYDRAFTARVLPEDDTAL